MSGNPHQYYDSFAEELIAKFSRVGQLVSHNTSTGDYHEEILRVVLRNFLSKRYSIKKGFIYKNETEVSNQLDIIIVDEYQVSAYIFQEGDFAIVRPAAVVAVIEVKTTLGAAQFDKAILNIASAKKLGETPRSICGIVFAYNSPYPSPTILNTWFNRKAAISLGGNPQLGPTIITFFQQGLLLARFNPKSSIIDDGTNYHAVLHAAKINRPSEPVSEGWQIRFILSSIYTVCESREFQRTRIFPNSSDANELLKYSGAVFSQDYSAFGTGFHSISDGKQ